MLDLSPSSYRDGREETEIVSLSEDKYAPVAYLRIKRARLEDKERCTDYTIATPELLEPKYSELHSAVEGAIASQHVGSLTVPSLVFEDHARTTRKGPWLALSNIVAKDLPANASLEEEVAACFHRLQGTRFCRLGHTVLLRTMFQPYSRTTVSSSRTSPT